MLENLKSFKRDHCLKQACADNQGYASHRSRFQQTFAELRHKQDELRSQYGKRIEPALGRALKVATPDEEKRAAIITSMSFGVKKERSRHMTAANANEINPAQESDRQNFFVERQQPNHRSVSRESI